jgi:hypothetical protein
MRIRLTVEGADTVWRLLFNRDAPIDLQVEARGNELDTVVVLTVSTEAGQADVTGLLGRVEALLDATNRERNQTDEREDAIKTAAYSWWRDREQNSLIS